MTMIENMARAMWGWDMQTQMFRTFDDESEETKRLFYERAKAALTALLDPNERMVDAAGTEIGFDNPTVDVVRAAIQAALDEKTP